MKITKCETCLKQYDNLFGECPHRRSLVDKIYSIGDIILNMEGNPVSSTIDELLKVIPQEFLDYDYPCKFYSPKPMTEGAFL